MTPVLLSLAITILGMMFGIAAVRDEPWFGIPAFIAMVILLIAIVWEAGK